MKNYYYILICTLVLVLGVFTGFTTIKTEKPTTNIHYCNWVDCSHQGEVMKETKFISEWGFEESTDGWCVELTHFMNPEMTYEQCEKYVFSGVE